MLGQAFEFVGTIVGSFFGSPEIGQAVGQVVGEAVGANKDMLGHNPRRYGQRLGSTELTTAKEGEPIPRVYGTAKVGGQLIWCSQYLETSTVTSSGGKGGTPKTKDTNYQTLVSFAVGLCEGETLGYGRIWVDGNPLDVNDKTIRFYKGTESQLADPIIQLVEGNDKAPAFKGLSYIVFEFLEVSRYGNRIPQIQVEVIRPLLETGDVETSIKAITLIPASGEFAYAPFKVTKFDVGDAEFSPDYDPRVQNINNNIGSPDVLVALDQLEASLPNLESVSIVVGWYGDDLRAGNCKIAPRVTQNNVITAYSGGQPLTLAINEKSSYKVTNPHLIDTLHLRFVIRGDGLLFGLDQEIVMTLLPESSTILGNNNFFSGNNFGVGLVSLPYGDYAITMSVESTSVAQAFTVSTVEQSAFSPRDWFVSGLARDQVPRVSTDVDSGRAVYGGTPSDLSVYELIKECKRRGWRVTFYPFIFMDIAPGNSLPNPYGGGSQPAFPWRGRITCHPAIGQVGTVDKTSTANTQISSLFGSCNTNQFASWNQGLAYYSGATIQFTGNPDEFSIRRMIFHYAHLCKEAGGVDAFVIGSELVGLTQVRSSASSFPAVSELVSIAQSVKTLLGSSTKITYAADWSEYHSYRPNDGTGDIYFNLDSLWASSSIDVIGIDNYLPLSDWRSGSTHLDVLAGHPSIYDIDYLKSNIEGGEGYDWFYASQSDRDNQIRTDIVDSAYADHWTFRQKDFKNWWLNSHRNRPSGVKGGTLPTGFEIANGSATILAVNGGRLTVQLQSDNSAGGSAVTCVMRTTQALSPNATIGETWTASVKGRVISTTHTMSVRVDGRNSSYTSVEGQQTTMTSSESVFTATRIMTSGSTVRASWRIGASVPAGAVFTAVVEIELPNLNRSSGANTINGSFSGAVSGLIGASTNATAWTPQSKPIWFTEFGCPAVDNGTNQPNVFYDPKSSESFFPYYSDGGADDYIQRQYLTATLQYWGSTANNLLSSVYGGRMLDTSNCAVWTWDTRPFPDFPFRLDVWSDGDLYQSGHWVQGRLGQYAPLYRVVRDICLKVGIDPDVDDLTVFPFSFRGMAFAGVTSPMEILKNLMIAYQFVGYESNGTVKFSLKSELGQAIPINADDIVLGGNKLQILSTRTQANEIPTDVIVDYISPQKEYNNVSVRTGNGLVTGQNVYTVGLPLVLEPRYASRLVHSLFNELYMSIEQVTITLPLKYAYLLPNDIVSLTLDGAVKQYRVVDVGIGSTITLNLTFVSHDIYSVFGSLDPDYGVTSKIVPAVPPTVHFLDLPILSVDQTNTNPRIAVNHNFPTQELDVYKVLGDTLVFNMSTDLLSTVGVLKSVLEAGPTDIWDNANVIELVVAGKTLESKTEFQVMQGANTLAVEHRPGVWEVLQFVNAELIAGSKYKLTKLRRGLLGTEGAMDVVSGIGSPVVLLDSRLQPHIVSVRGAVQTFKYGPESLPTTDTAYVTKTVGFNHVALRPYSVVDVRHTKSAGDITFTWLRRSRISGFTWDYTTLPLGEEYEKYEIDVLDGSTVVRTVSVNTPSFTYNASQQTADFGSVPSSFVIDIYQMSAVYGRGQRRTYEYNA